jgi:predicted O-methyltransferase YrrM
VLQGQLYVFWQYCRYFLEKVDQHSLHSPFLYECYAGLLNHKNDPQTINPHLESMRAKWLREKVSLPWVEKGAGSHFKGKKTVSSICRISNSSLKYNLLYQYFCGMTPGEYILELGGSLGINTGYLATHCKGKLYSFEADPNLLRLAKATLDKSYPEVVHVEGDITATLPATLEILPKVDFAFLDANHTYAATLSYFESILPKLHDSSIVVIGDIYWSKGMTKAWKTLTNHPKITLSLDFFESGVLFLNPDLNRETFVLHY